MYHTSDEFRKSYIDNLSREQSVSQIMIYQAIAFFILEIDPLSALKGSNLFFIDGLLGTKNSLLVLDSLSITPLGNYGASARPSPFHAWRRRCPRSF